MLLVASLAPPRLIAQATPTGPLAAQLAPFMQAPASRGASWGALVVSLTTGDTLFSWRADRPFIPASNAKLFTTAAALHYLTPGYRFLTVLYADGPVEQGVLRGNLVLYGTGDPTFALDTAALAPFADNVVRAGIRTVRGDVVGDASFLGGELTGPGWSPDDLGSAYAAPPSALGAAENRITLTVRPASRVGLPATVRVDPPNDYYAVQSVVITGRAGDPTSITLTRGASRGVIDLAGTIPVTSGGWSQGVPVEEPAVFAAALLRQLLRARGISVTGATRAVSDDASARAARMLSRAAEGRDPFSGAIAVRRSAPLDQIVSMINHRSHNLSAELALRTIGRMVEHEGSYASGTRAVERFLTRDVGIAPNAVMVSDGSGLSILDAATPRALVQLLAYMRRAPEAAAFVASLPAAGEGLHGRMRGTAAAGRLRAKTGTLDGVSALAGYVTTLGGEELAFSIIVNRAPSLALARAAQDSIGVRLSLLSRPVPAGGRARRSGAASRPRGCCR